MILFLLGLVLGAAMAGAVSYVYAQNEAKALMHEHALLRARLRTLVRMAEAGLLKPGTVEAANALNEVHEMVFVPGDPAGRENGDVRGTGATEERLPPTARH